MAETVADRVKQEGGTLFHIQDGEMISIAPWGRDGLRVRVSAGGAIGDTAWALIEPVAPTDSTIKLNDTEVTIRNGKISASISDILTQPGYLQFFRHTADGEKTCILKEHDYIVGAHNPGTRIFQPRDDGLFYTETHFEAKDGERLYGMGLNATGRVNLKGCVIDLYQRHVKHVVPFLVPSEGYGFLWNNPSLGRGRVWQQLDPLGLSRVQTNRLLPDDRRFLRRDHGALCRCDGSRTRVALLGVGILAVQEPL